MIAIGDAFLVAMIGGLIFALYRGLRPAIGLALIAVLVLILTRYGLLQRLKGRGPRCDAALQCWTLLIIRDAFLGLRRFDEFQESLGIARNVLTDRLVRLVEEGILDRVRYSERPERFEYRLTAKVRDLVITLAGLRQWATST